MINKSTWPSFHPFIIKSVSNIIKSGKVNYWTGENGRKFEKFFAQFHNRKYATAVSSGSMALDIAIKSLELDKDDEIITTPRSYYASSISIINNNHNIKFCDIELNSHNLDPLSVKKNISKKTKALLIVHLAGVPCDMKSFMKLKKKYNLKIIEDCSQAHGSKYNNQIVGSFGDISIWSFCNDKIISTLGEGGMITTNNKKLYEKVWSFKEIGKDLKKTLNIYKSKKNGFKWVHDGLGTNSRMTEIQSVSGIYQLKNLKKNIFERRKRAEIFIKILKRFTQISIQYQNEKSHNAFYRLYFTITPNQENSFLRNKIINSLKKLGVEARVDACPEIYKEKYFLNNFNPKKIKGGFKNTKIVGRNSISLKVDSTISLKAITKSSKILNDILKVYFKTN